MPEIAAAARMKQMNVIGIFRPIPPSFSSEVVPVCFSTDPAVRNRQLLYIAWLIMWKRPPMIPTGIAVPTPSTMYPTWLIA